MPFTLIISLDGVFWGQKDQLLFFSSLSNPTNNQQPTLKCVNGEQREALNWLIINIIRAY